MYWILFWPFFSLAATRNPIWITLFAGPIAFAAYGWHLCGVKGRPPERGACATLGLLDLGIIGIVAAQKGAAGQMDGSVIRAAIGLPVVLWLACGMPTPQFGLPTRGRHSRRLIALLAMALVVSAGVEWLAVLAPTMSKAGTPPIFWPLFLGPLPFYLTPLWSVLADGWRAPKSVARLPGLSELWELPEPDSNRNLTDREHLIRMLLQAESDAYRSLLNRLDQPALAASALRSAQVAFYDRGFHAPDRHRARSAMVERLVEVALQVEDRDPETPLLLVEALETLPAETRELLSSWLVGGRSFAELLAASRLTSNELRTELRWALALLTEAAEDLLRGETTVVVAAGVAARN